MEAYRDFFSYGGEQCGQSFPREMVEFVPLGSSKLVPMPRDGPPFGYAGVWCVGRVSGFGGFATRPAPKKKTPSFGGENVGGTGQTTPGKPAKPAKAATLVDWIDHCRCVYGIHLYGL